jgi:hypothetical protein
MHNTEDKIMDYFAAGGLLIGLGYHYYGKEAVKGNYYWKNTKLHKRRFL